MQTETIFRAARCLYVVSHAIKTTQGDRVQFSFRPSGRGTNLFVTFTGLPIGDTAADEGTIMEAVARINEYAGALPDGDDFSLQFVMGQTFEVEAA